QREEREGSVHRRRLAERVGRAVVDRHLARRQVLHRRFRQVLGRAVADGALGLLLRRGALRRLQIGHAAASREQKGGGARQGQGLSRRRLLQSALRARTCSGAVPPKLWRLAQEASGVSTSYTPSVIRPSRACNSLSGNSPRPRPSASARFTAAPVTWCAWRKGRFSSRTSQSARSVAVEKPAPAAAAIFSVLGRITATMAVMAVSARSSASKASNTGGLSSCMSLE